MVVNGNIMLICIQYHPIPVVCPNYFKQQTTTLECCSKERLANLYFYILVYINQTWKNENVIGYIIFNNSKTHG